jgi:hypothetical protein
MKRMRVPSEEDQLSHSSGACHPEGDESMSVPPITAAAPLADGPVPAKPPSNIRHSEKNRVSSSLFADAAAQIVLRAFRTVCPTDLQHSVQQTVVAGVVACRGGTQSRGTGVNANSEEPALRKDQDEVKTSDTTCDRFIDRYPGGIELECIALGMGTKFLRTMELMQDTAGCKIRDSHAEVLANRALKIFLYEEIARHLQHLDNGSADRPSQQTSSCDDDFVLEPIVDASCHVEGRPSQVGLRGFRLRQNVTLHFYCSSQPCGNACWRRWGNGRTTQPEAADLQTVRLPESVPHPPLHVVARNQGQVALLAKKEACTTSLPETVPGGNAWKDCPEGVAPLPEGGRILSCSDKVARWNVLGLQGTLLSCFITEPLYFRSIVVGRKAHSLHAERAFCCRLQSLSKLMSPMPMHRKERPRQEEPSTKSPAAKNPFQLNHPVMLTTALKLDESVRSQETKASFAEQRCLLWYRRSAQSQLRSDSPGIAEGTWAGSNAIVLRDGEQIDGSASSGLTPGSRADLWHRFQLLVVRPSPALATRETANEGVGAADSGPYHLLGNRVNELREQKVGYDRTKSIICGGRKQSRVATRSAANTEDGQITAVKEPGPVIGPLCTDLAQVYSLLFQNQELFSDWPSPIPSPGLQWSTSTD